MPDADRGVWVTRPQPGSLETCAALVAAGYAAISVPVLEIAWVSPKRPLSPWPDWMVLVSQNAVEGCARAFADLPNTVRCAAVGRRTAQAARERGWQVEILPQQQDANGLTEALIEHGLHGASIWIPSGNRPGSGQTTLPEALRRLGADVEVVEVYETRDRQPTGQQIDELMTTSPDAIVFHSPSAVRAVFASHVPVFKNWRDHARAIAIGPTTAASLAEFGIAASQAREPSTTGILAALLKAFDQPRSDPS